MGWLDDLDEERDAVLGDARRRAAEIIATAEAQARRATESARADVEKTWARAAELVETHARRVIEATDREREVRWHAAPAVPPPLETPPAAPSSPETSPIPESMAFSGVPDANGRADPTLTPKRRHHPFRRRRR